MQQRQFNEIKRWFDKFAASFYGDDEFINANLKLKENHTTRVCKETKLLTNRLSLEQDQAILAHTIALLHDVARFPQFAQYKTYWDHKSLNHCTKAVEILQQQKVLENLDPHEKDVILTAIKFHGEKTIPDDLDPDTTFFSKLIRDTDKIDIYYVYIDNITEYRDCPEKYPYEVELPDKPECSPEIINLLLSTSHIDYRICKTINDATLIRLGWVYDINFSQSLVRIRQRRFLSQLFDTLPPNGQIEQVKNHIFSYVDNRISQQNTKLI